MRVTALGPDEIDLLLAVPAGLFDDDIRPDQARAYLADPANILLLAFDGPLAVGLATATVMRHPDKGPWLFVNELGTRDSHLRQGIATALMQHLFAMGRARGCEAFWLATETDNTPALALYRKLGGTAETFVGFDWDQVP